MLCDPVCIRQSTDETSNTKKAQKYLFEAESDSNKVWGEGGGGKDIYMAYKSVTVTALI